jgi:aspartate kinase
MKVLKFGGTSVGSADRMKHVAKLIHTKEEKIVVLSAMSGTTNKLAEICEYLYKNNFDTANELIIRLESEYKDVIDSLYKSKEAKNKANTIINAIFKTIQSFVGSTFNEAGEKIILAQGELMSTNLFHIFLIESGIDSVLLPALVFMRTNEKAEPDFGFIREQLNTILKKYKNKKLFITQGYICKNIHDKIDNLQRGGSDYTASIVGYCTNSREVQIWTDIDGMHNNDPRIVDKTYSIDKLSFDEAAELAYFGAKILHPTSILPAKMGNIPVILKNTMNPKATGTIISKEEQKAGIKAIAAKDNITMIRIKSGRMLLAYGFLRKVFDIFEKYQTPIDMIATSEVGVSVTIDTKKRLNNITEELKEYGSVYVFDNQTIICMVGYQLTESQHTKPGVFEALKDISVQMISFGGSMHNISVLIDTENKSEALIKLNKKLF